MVRRKKHLSLWITLIAFLLLTALFFTTAISAANEIPRVTEYSRSRLSSGVPFSTYEKLPESYREELTVCAELNTEIAGEIGELKPVLVNENFFDVYGIHVGGSAVTKEHIRNNIRAVIVSDQIALRMSLDGSVIGQTVPLFGQDFTVVGIYKKPDGFLHEISSDIYNRVYIPYTCYDNYAEISIDALAATKGTYSEKALPLLGLTETDTNFYIENDLAIKHDIIANLPTLFLSICSIIITIICLRQLIALLKSTLIKLHEDYENFNVMRIISRNKRFIFTRLLCVILMIGIPIALLIFFPIRLIIPQNYIPYDNIFEFSHYSEAIKTTLQISNSNIFICNLYYNHLFFVSFIFDLALLVNTISILILIYFMISEIKTKCRVP